MKSLYFYLIAFILNIPMFVFAQSGTGVGQSSGGAGTSLGNNSNSGITIPNPLGDKDIYGLFLGLLQILLVFAVPIIVFFIIYAGFLYVTARGNVEQISQAHKALLYAVIGGVLILGGNILIEVVGNTVDAVRNG